MKEVNLVAEPGKQMVEITHIFDAPRDLVWKVYTDPKLMPKWWGPKILKTTIDKMDMRTGGSWRVIQQDPEGNETAFHGVYHEVLAPERIIDTMEWEGMPGHVLFETVIFEELDGKTKVTNKSVFQSVEDRDGMLNTGMEIGVKESNERFAELLKEIQGKS
jgi:uncharacterized protein YndB with AHSA1/START domain